MDNQYFEESNNAICPGRDPQDNENFEDQRNIRFDVVSRCKSWVGTEFEQLRQSAKTLLDIFHFDLKVPAFHDEHELSRYEQKTFHEILKTFSVESQSQDD